MSGDLLPTGTFQDLPKRHLTTTSCEVWGYHCTTYKGSPCQVADYRDGQGTLVAQKVRFGDKTFVILGDARSMGLYGKHRCREAGKRVVITEGEIDAISVSQVQDHKWPVLSVPNGANAAKKAIQADLEFLESFEEVILCFDNDDPGVNAAKECALLFTPGKCKIATLPLKDANDMLVKGKVAELTNALWSAKVFRPDGIVAGVDLWESISTDPEGQNFPTPWPALDACIGGLRKGEILTWCAGSGIGKSQFCREIAYSLIRNGHKVGYIALEESVKRTALGLMGIHVDKPLHITKKDTSDVELRNAFDATVGSGCLYLYDHFGSLDSDNLISRIRYLARSCECGWIVLDHISIAVSGIADGDERRIIDNLMTKLRSLVQETGVGMLLVSHLRRPQGESHEEGGLTSLAQLRGSASIGQLSDGVIGVERNQQDPAKRHISTLRVLKGRWNGYTGVACEIKFNPETGRLSPVGPFDGSDPKAKAEGIF